jgi:hypothetical protein
MDTKSAIKELADEIKRKSELDARYYVGALEGLQVLLDRLSLAESTKEETAKDEKKPRKGSKP